MTYPKIGSVSEGTLRAEDLVDTFASELSYHIKRMRLTRAQRKGFSELLRDACGDQNEKYEIVDKLQDALSEIAPPYSYFGASEGDGACFGFWPIINDELARVAAGDAIPREHWGEDVLIINDHGNCECGYVDKRGKFHEYWSCV